MENLYIVICTPFLDEVYADVQLLSVDRLYFSTDSDIIFISVFNQITDKIREQFPKKKIIVRIENNQS